MVSSGLARVACTWPRWVVQAAFSMNITNALIGPIIHSSLGPLSILEFCVSRMTMAAVPNITFCFAVPRNA